MKSRSMSGENLNERTAEPSAAVKRLLSEVSLEIELAKQQKNILNTILTPVKAEPEVPAAIKKIRLTDTQAGENELGSTFKKALESELQDVMIKMWQELPDDSPLDVDKHVINKFRGELGDEFANLLGLNVRKRILGLTNTLFVKVKFDSFISAACLSGFLKQYNVQKAKKVDGHKYVFVAKMKDYADFDALCNTKELVYDQVKFEVEPCLKFMTCPDILSTDKITTETKDKKNEEINESITEKTSSKEHSRNERTKDSRIERHKYSDRGREVERSSRLSRHRIKDGLEGSRYREETSDGKSKSSTNGEMKSKSSRTSIEKPKSTKNSKDNKVKTEISDSKDNAEVKTEKINLKDSVKIKTDGPDNNEPKYQNSEKKDENSKSQDTKKASEGSKDLEIGDDLDFEDMAMLLADSIVLDECSGSEDEGKS